MIGVFDSGLGGLGVAAAIRRLSSDVDLVVLADQANAPYGDREAEEIRGFAEVATDTLVRRGCATVVVACNTASTVALAHLRRIRPQTAFVGMEPAVKPAVARTATGVIAVLGTTATIGGRLLADVTARFAADCRVIGVPMPGLVEMVEDGLADTPAIDRFVADRLAPALAAGADTIVLACTHYGFAQAAIEAAAGPGVVVVDPAEAVARQALRVGGEAGDGGLTLLTSGDPVRTRRQVRAMVGWDVPVAPVGAAQRSCSAIT